MMSFLKNTEARVIFYILNGSEQVELLDTIDGKILSVIYPNDFEFRIKPSQKEGRREFEIVDLWMNLNDGYEPIRGFSTEDDLIAWSNLCRNL